MPYASPIQIAAPWDIGSWMSISDSASAGAIPPLDETTHWLGARSEFGRDPRVLKTRVPLVQKHQYVPVGAAHGHALQEWLGRGTRES